MKISIGYPEISDEQVMADRFINKQYNSQLEAVVSKEDVMIMQEEVEEVKVHQDLINYITKRSTNPKG